MSTLYVLVPVFNESGNVDTLIDDLVRLQEGLANAVAVHAVLVDDGSRDDTAGRVRRRDRDVPITLLRHEVNQGPGVAFATGFAHLKPRLEPGDWVATMEGDNTSRIGTLRQMWVRRLEGYEVVLASPYAYGGGFSNTSWGRTFLSHAANGMAKVILGIRGILTFSSFFRLYDYVVLQRLYAVYGERIMEMGGFGCMLELLCKLIYVGATISEVPLKLDTSMRAGRSKMKIPQTVLSYVHVFLRCRAWKAQALAAARGYGRVEPGEDHG
jgi:dolichol-phosphate mannosyltransferase